MREETRETPERAETAWLPPGQVPTEKWPVVGERRAAAPDGGEARGWRLLVEGLVERPLDLNFPEVLALPQQEIVRDLHCVTGWSRRGASFTGTPLGLLLERAVPHADARFVRFVADSPRAHDTSLPLGLAAGDSWVVHAFAGRPLEPHHGGPLRSLTPSRYLYKSVKWLRRIELLAEDRLGYWERDAGYHNGADPWREQRYVTGAVKPGDLARLRAGRRLDAFRGRRILGVDLRGWTPTDRNLRDLVLRASDLRASSLAHADLRGANLTRSDLRGADLAGADLRGADLEGTDLRGADLRGADLRGAWLTAARLADPATRLAGARLAAEMGLLDEEEAWARRAAASPDAG